MFIISSNIGRIKGFINIFLFISKLDRSSLPLIYSTLQNQYYSLRQKLNEFIYKIFPLWLFKITSTYYLDSVVQNQESLLFLAIKYHAKLNVLHFF